LLDVLDKLYQLYRLDPVKQVKAVKQQKHMTLEIAMQRKSLTRAEHRALGAKLAAVHDALVGAECRIAYVLGVTHAAYRAAREARRWTHELRTLLAHAVVDEQQAEATASDANAAASNK
jgi:hypothetical protein